MIFEMLVFGFIGLGLESAFTGIFRFLRFREVHMMGHSSPWYIPLYAMLPPFYFTYGERLMSYDLIQRGLFYIIAFHVIEYFGMLILRWYLGSSPSEESYYKSKYQLHGLTKFTHAPAFCAAGFFFEGVYYFIH